MGIRDYLSHLAFPRVTSEVILSHRRVYHAARTAGKSKTEAMVPVFIYWYLTVYYWTSGSIMHVIAMLSR